MKIVTVLVTIAFVTLGVTTAVTAGPFEDFVTGLYQLVLGRTPSDGEVTFYASYYSQHPSRAGVGSIVDGFFGSQEFIETIPFTPTTYATMLYQAVLERAPDPGGLSGFTAAVTEILISIVPDFVASAEFQGLGVQNSAAAFVQRLYVEALGRPPGGGEEMGWIALVGAGQSLTVVRGIFGSAEYTTTARTLTDHVTILYRSILGRQPADVEVQGWAHVLASRLALINEAFIGSDEFQVYLARIGAGTAGASPRSLTAADVTSVVQGAAQAVDVPLVIAVVDRIGNPLALFSKPGAPGTATGNFGGQVDATELAVSLARTGAFFSNSQAPLSSRTVRFISGIHFPPGITNKANAALYGIENTNRGCSLNTLFNPGKTITPARSLNGLPCTAFDRRGCGLGITTGKADTSDSNPNAVNPGGVPIFKNGLLVGGIGVVAPRVDIAEYAALVGSVSAPGLGPVVPDPGVILLDGIVLPFVVQKTQPPGTSPGALAGSFSVGPTASPLGDAGVPEGWLVGPFSGIFLTADEVTRIVQQANDQANLSRAAIRLPLGSTTRMMIAVADLDGTMLGLFRMPDATIFSIDVSVAKARNVIYFSGPTRTGADLPGVPFSTQVTNRTISFGAQPLYPPGIDGSGPGPFFPLFLNDVATACSQGAQAANANQSGIVFFPGSTPLWKNGQMVGGLGVSGDGVEQDDLVSAGGATGFAPPTALRADQVFVGGIRLPYFKFPRNPEAL